MKNIKPKKRHTIRELKKHYRSHLEQDKKKLAEAKTEMEQILSRLSIATTKGRLNSIKKYPTLYKKKACMSALYGLPSWQTWFVWNDVVLKPASPSDPIINYPKKDRASAEVLVDLLSFLTYRPMFIETADQELNRFLSDLYDLISSHKQTGSYTYYPDFNSPDYDIFELKGDLDYPILISLYSAALKQPEPLSKCIFLWRIVEYACEAKLLIHDIPGKKYATFTNACFEQAILWEFNPVWTEAKKHSHLKTSKAINLVPYWKKLTKLLLKDILAKHGTVGDFIYGFARGGSAHAKPSQVTLLHDYSENYQSVALAECYLELIARFLIEKSNPNIRSVISSKSPLAKYG